MVWAQTQPLEEILAGCQSSVHIKGTVAVIRIARLRIAAGLRGLIADAALEEVRAPSDSGIHVKSPSQ